MARVIYSALVTEIKGSVGGTTFQRNAYGFTIKNKPAMINPKSDRQNRSKKYLSITTQYWRQLTDSSRASWAAFANTYPQYSKHNSNSQLSGFAVFVKWHTAKFLSVDAVNALIEFPSFVVPASASATFTLRSNAERLFADFEIATGGNTWSHLISISRPVDASQRFVGSSLRYLYTVLYMSDNVDITNLYVAMYGLVPQPGQILNVGIKSFMKLGGLVQATQLLRVTVTLQV